MPIVRGRARESLRTSLQASLVFALVVPACHSQGPVVQTLTQDASTTDATSPTCLTDKLRFTQETACVNDGSVELCIANGDDATRDAVLAIAPTTVCQAGSAGRAGCDTTTDALCLVPIDPSECTDRHGAMLEAAWSRICAIAALDAVREIVPTWFE